MAAAATSTLVERILSRAIRSGTVAPSVDLVTERARLAALDDGLTLRSVLHLERFAPDLAHRALTCHIEGLRRQAHLPADP